MVTQKGITSLKQYMSLKPIKRGIKLWCRADSITGYLCAFDVYTGKQPSRVQHDLGYTVVWSLWKNMTSKWYCLFLQFLYFLKTYGKPVQLKSTLLWNCPTKRKGISLCTIPQDHNKDFASGWCVVKNERLHSTYSSCLSLRSTKEG